jgi:P27 family predicted phage terminase small subunit
MRGTYRPHRHAGHDPKPKGELLEPPGWLSPDQKKRFSQILRDAPPKLLRRWDAGLLASYVVTESIIAETTLACATPQGCHLLELNSKGTMNMNPLLKIQSRFIPILRTLGSELGFSPASRAGLRLPEEDGSGDFDTRRWDGMLEAAKRNQVEMKEAYARQRARLELVEETSDADEAPEVPPVACEEQSREPAELEEVPERVPPETVSD